MGYTWIHKPAFQSVKETLTKELLRLDCKVLAISVKEPAAYIAIQESSKNEVSATVALFRKDSHAEYNFGYKLVHEELGPYITRCPLYILNMLTPTNDAYAKEWRKACAEKRAPDYEQARKEANHANPN